MFQFKRISMLLTLSAIFGICHKSYSASPLVWEAPSETYSQMEKSIKNPSESVEKRYQYLKENKSSINSPRMYAFVGRELYAHGYFTDAMECFSLGWNNFKDEQDPDLKMFADLCGAELAQMYARIGRVDDLRNFFNSVKGRDFIGPASGLMDNSSSALQSMVERPEIAFKCGPYALQSILNHKAKKNKQKSFINKQIEESLSESTGYNLKEVQSLSKNVGLDFDVYKIENFDNLKLPCVVHWKLNHYAAIVEEKNGLYRVADPTFGKDLWISKDALKKEASGYILSEKNSSNTSFKKISDNGLLKSVHGKGYLTGYDEGGYGPCDSNTGECGSSCQGMAADPRPKPTPPKTPTVFAAGKGMPVHSFHLMNASLRLEDTPLWYNPPYGGEMAFTVRYNQRDTKNHLIYNISSFGHQWTSDFISYIEYDSSNLYGGATIVTPGGGSTHYSNFNNMSNSYDTNSYGDHSLHMDPIGPATSTAADGTKYTYGRVKVISGTQTILLLTKIKNNQGDEVNIIYDSYDRIRKIVDAAGGESVFCYDENVSGACLPLIRSITDPHGRTAYFNYDSQNRLTSIRDMIGMESSFTYDGLGSFVNSMTTPYGTTTFKRELYGDVVRNHDRFIESTDPLGHKERVETVAEVNSTYINNLFQNKFPVESMYDGNRTYLEYRNTFYWDKVAMKTNPASYDSATIYRFLHSPIPNVRSRLLESVKKPLESAVVYRYKNQDSNPLFEGPNVEVNAPVLIAKRMDNNQTQTVEFDYNSKGNKIKEVDPTGREFRYNYASNGINLTSIEAKEGSSYVTLATFSYDSKNRPTSLTNAAGAATTIGYHSTLNLPVSITNALSETYTFDYTTTGLLSRISTPNTNNYVNFSYGEYDHVVSATAFPENYTVAFEYDKLNRITKRSDAEGSEKYVYDKLDLIATRNKLNLWTKYAFDANRNLISKTDAEGKITQYVRCGCGLLDKIIDPLGNETLYTYDGQSRLKSYTMGGSDVYRFFYGDNSGRLIRYQDAKNQNRNYTYNIDDTLAAITVTNVASGTASVSPVYMNWDPNHKRTTAWGDNLGTRTLTYGSYNSVLTSSPNAGKLTAYNSPLANDNFTYSYDLLGRMINSTSGGAITYDTMGRISSITNPLGTFNNTYLTNSYIPASMQEAYSGLKAHLDAPNPYHNSGNRDITYTKDSMSTSTLLSEFDMSFDKGRRANYFSATYDPIFYGLRHLSTHNNNNNLTEEVVEDFLNYTDTHVNAWNIDAGENRVNEQKVHSTWGQVSRREIAYNNKNQVTSTTSGGPAFVSGIFDRPVKVESLPSVGDVASHINVYLQHFVSAWVNTSSFTNAIVKISDYSGNTRTENFGIPAIAVPTHTFTYDANGNMTSKVTTGIGGSPVTTRNFKWDALDRLVEIQDGTLVTELSYDGLDRMIKIKDKNGSLVTNDHNFTWDGDKLYSGQSDYFPGGGEPTLFFDQGALRQSTKERLYLKDQLGSVRGIFYNGAVQNWFDYDAYGKPKQVHNSIEEEYPFLWNGQFYHKRTGLYLYKRRVYDPEFGRWLSREPSGLDGPNMYHFVFNSPYMYVDHQGEFAFLLPLIPAAIPVIYSGASWMLGMAIYGRINAAFESETCMEQASIKYAVRGAVYGTGLGLASTLGKWGAGLVLAGLEGFSDNPKSAFGTCEKVLGALKMDINFDPEKIILDQLDDVVPSLRADCP